MNAGAVLEELRGKGVRVSADGGHLDLDAPPGALSDELVGRVHEVKPSLLLLVSEKYSRPGTEAGAPTTYDINDKTPPARSGAGVSELFADPPRWLCRQAAEYRKAPYERMLGPLVQAVRLHIALARSPEDAPTAALRAGPGTAEIRPEVERELGSRA